MRIREKRQERNISIEDIARFLNVSIQCIYNYETGKRNPKPDTLKAMAKFFGCTIDELL